MGRWVQNLPAPHHTSPFDQSLKLRAQLHQGEETSGILYTFRDHVVAAIDIPQGPVDQTAKRLTASLPAGA
jgi:hypothetical protein